METKGCRTNTCDDKAEEGLTGEKKTAEGKIRGMWTGDDNDTSWHMSMERL